MLVGFGPFLTFTKLAVMLDCSLASTLAVMVGFTVAGNARTSTLVWQSCGSL
jgi:hypothetical protein